MLCTIHLGRGCWWTPYCLLQSARPTSQEPRKVGEKERKIAKLLELSQQKTKIFYLGYFFHIFKVFLNHILENVSALRSWTKAHWNRFNSRNKREKLPYREQWERWTWHRWSVPGWWSWCATPWGEKTNIILGKYNSVLGKIQSYIGENMIL